MIRARAQCIVHRNGKILMVRHRFKGQEWWCLPGGGVKPGEEADAAALRELNEECCLDGKLVRLLSRYTDDQGVDIITYLVDIGKQQPHLGADPELTPDEQILREVRWLSLGEICERDRAYLWAAGLLCVSEFLDELTGWGDEISYPARKSKV
jgi:8-oxo-dGTP diphosphatase